MSVSQFPNADIQLVDQLTDLIDALVPAPDPAIEADIILIFAAYMYAAVEQIINMQSLPLHHTLDPQTMIDIRALLDSGR